MPLNVADAAEMLELTKSLSANLFSDVAAEGMSSKMASIADDRLLSAFEDYSNRPVQVSVVEINNKQEAVRNVQVLAGLSE